MRIVVLPGDGIGPEITAATTGVLRAASERFQLESAAGGARGRPRQPETVRHHRAARAARHRARRRRPDPRPDRDLRLQGRGAAARSIRRSYFRKSLDLYANVRPARTYPGRPGRLGDFDLVVVRENTEGFYADRNMEQGSGEMLVTPDVVISLRRITRLCCERIAHAACRLAMKRRKHLTIVHKANVLKIGDGMFLDICRDGARRLSGPRGRRHPGRRHDGACGAQPRPLRRHRRHQHVRRHPVRPHRGALRQPRPRRLAQCRRDHAMAQAAHGSAPDIAGQDVANPVSLILSTALLLGLAWRAKRRGPLRGGGARDRGGGGDGASRRRRRRAMSAARSARSRRRRGSLRVSGTIAVLRCRTRAEAETALRRALQVVVRAALALRSRPSKSELIPPQTAVDRDHGARDVARQRRGEEYRERGEVLGLAPIATGNLLLGKPLAIIRRIVAPDLLAHDAAGRNAVDGDAVLADLA